MAKSLSVLASVVSLLCCGPVAIVAGTHTVPPPSGTDDTANLQAAIDYCVPGGADCIIQLAPGAYRTEQIRAINFHGTIKGAGIEQTVIEALPELEVTDDWYPNLPSPTNKWAAVIGLYNSSLRMTDLTIRVPAYQATKQWSAYFGTFNMLAAILYLQGPETGPVEIARVKFAGGPGTFMQYNLRTGAPEPTYNAVEAIGIDGAVGLTARITASQFVSLVQALFLAENRGARFLIGGSPSHGNMFFNVNTAVVSLNNVGGASPGKLEFSYNVVQAVGDYAPPAVNLYAYSAPDRPSDVLIAHNDIANTGLGSDGVWIQDLVPFLATGRGMNVLVESNTFRPGGDALDAVGLFLAEGAVVRNNRIRGTAQIGINAVWARQCVLAGNNLQGFVVSGALDWALPAAILLSEGSTNCTVVGGRSDLVLDYGTDNVVMGAGHIKGTSPGPTLSDAMRLKMERLKAPKLR